MGNPNSGKSSLFNALTGLNQQVGNFSGVTVDRFSGIWNTRNHGNHQLIDLPGVYSLHPKSIGEHVVREVLLDKNQLLFPIAEYWQKLCLNYDETREIWG